MAEEAAELAGFLVLAGMAFVLVNHSLAAWLGNVGRLIAIAFAVITTVTAVTSAVPAIFDSLRPLSPLYSCAGRPAGPADRLLPARPPAVFTLVGWAWSGSQRVHWRCCAAAPIRLTRTEFPGLRS